MKQDKLLLLLALAMVAAYLYTHGKPAAPTLTPTGIIPPGTLTI